jgi:Neutral/alkaline non-lysosomal ceramidase, N-terminal
VRKEFDMTEPSFIQRIKACLVVTTLLGSAALASGSKTALVQGQAGQLRAGAATSNITPFLGAPIVGGWESPPATQIHDELHARCLVLDDGRTRVAIVVCDSVGIARQVFDQAKRLVHEHTGLPLENMLMAATHTHSGPSARGANAFAFDAPLDEYQRFLARRIADGVRRALRNLEPARVGWGVGRQADQVFNRRWKMKPGTPLPNPFGGQDRVLMNPGIDNPNLLEPAGPTDPEIHFISIQSTRGRPIALLANYSLHYVGGTGGAQISADYFAMFADRIQQLLGAERLEPPFVGIMSNGNSGDVNNINVRGPRESLPPYQKMRQVANIVADEVFKAYQEVKYNDSAELAVRQREIQLQVRKPTPQQIARAQEILARPADAKPAHVREVEYARRTVSLSEWPPQVSVVLQALRVGEVGIAAIPFEVFAETGLELKQKSPLKPTFTIELANGWYGYLPTPEQHELGGYETWLGTNRVEVQASRKIVAALLDLFAQLK